jgi:hypothetical protein
VPDADGSDQAFSNIDLVERARGVFFRFVEKPWSDVTMIFVVAAKFNSVRVALIRARSSAALRIAAIEAGPFMPGTSFRGLFP